MENAQNKFCEAYLLLQPTSLITPPVIFENFEIGDITIEQERQSVMFLQNTEIDITQTPMEHFAAQIMWLVFIWEDNQEQFKITIMLPNKNKPSSSRKKSLDQFLKYNQKIGKNLKGLLYYPIVTKDASCNENLSTSFYMTRKLNSQMFYQTENKQVRHYGNHPMIFIKLIDYNSKHKFYYQIDNK